MEKHAIIIIISPINSFTHHKPHKTTIIIIMIIVLRAI